MFELLFDSKGFRHIQPRNFVATKDRSDTFIIQRLPMTRQYYFLVALLMSELSDRMTPTRGMRARAIDSALERNKNKVTSLRIRSRASCTGQFFFLPLTANRPCAVARNGSKLRDPRAVALVAPREDAIDTCTLNPCSLFWSRIARRVLIPKFIRGNVIFES